VADWKPAKDASAQGWTTPFLIGLLDDPYDAVRLIAYRSLRALPGMQNFGYDYTAPHERRLLDVSEALALWRAAPLASPSPFPPRLLYDETGTLDGEAVQRLASQRDDRRVSLRE